MFIIKGKNKIHRILKEGRNILLGEKTLEYNMTNVLTPGLSSVPPRANWKEALTQNRQFCKVRNPTLQS